MNIVVDENIPLGKDAFSTLGNVSVLPGRQISSSYLQEASALIVRSVTSVNKKLLAGTPVKFVGTATAGIDHIDQEYLNNQQIGFADAAGSNANSVAEYVLTALAIIAQRFQISLKGKTLGIVGVGRIGRLVANHAKVLGMEVILNDPPLARKSQDQCYRPLEEALQADFVTLHVPLINEGVDKTVHLIGEKKLAAMSSSSILFNTCRGEVIDNHALLLALKNQQIQGAVLDVWEGEPSIHWDLAHTATIATPHIAGYSFDGKIKGTSMIYSAACDYFGIAPTWKFTEDAPPLSHPGNAINAHGHNLEHLLVQLAPRLYDLQGDDTRMRSLLVLPMPQRPTRFDQLRRQYPKRREFYAFPLLLQDADPGVLSDLDQLGFSIHQFEK
ncbi:4-phosphoerythronate dehydrogenase [Candidatus Nitronereus thalassa]|uniref:4-phosphoerythronate dehydrogenase n=1 Tax=Candidatus Nitronereus thalassa TaxID=3020898 RepID=A0ABU3K885_9BACT|nr:4-phosphoerythronate dehydrogenase [Candidatus Nitronereus thalassa]MDT7042659.1 4-phosphoerythronate dehydrogenase [Candidatus Nitronereus thalassa]